MPDARKTSDFLATGYWILATVILWSLSTLSKQDVQRIAELARLELSNDELDLFTRQLGDILTYVEQIRALDTTGVAPTSQVLNRPVDRDDVPGATLTRPQLLGNAPDAATEAGLFKVPRVIG
jgi:aspartyl-tRNA(Asn)/glutamyl-tRNA(Gln) amidotransferase subunit C